MIPAHNCAVYLEPCLQSVMGQLGQRPDAEIIVVDDGSSDHPEDVVLRVGGDRVRIVRNETALGAIPNFNACLSLASGELIHLLHGDDLVLPGFYDEMDAAFSATAPAAAFCRTQHIDGEGNPLAVTRSYVQGGGLWRDALSSMASANRVAAPSIVVAADTYAAVGGFDEALPHAADWDMWARCAAHGPIHFVDRVLAQYRVHAANDTSKRLRTGANMSERFTALEHILTYVPDSARPRLRRRGRALGAVYASRQARRRLFAGDVRTAGVQASWALRSAWGALTDGK